MILAHYDSETKKQQSLNQHNKNVGLLSRCFDSVLNLNSLGKLIGIMHDFGKCKHVYQDYLIHNRLELKGKIDHSTIGARYLYDMFFNDGTLYEKLTVQIISMIICSHHSYLLDFISIDESSPFLKRMQKFDEGFDEAVFDFTSCCYSEIEITNLFNKASKEIECILQVMPKRSHNAIEMIYHLGLLVRYCYSSLIDADCYDTLCFYEQRQLELSNNKNEFWKGCRNKLEKYINYEFCGQNDLINQYRSEISEQCKAFAKNGKGIYRLYVPTGGGKTISSLRYALHHACEQGDIDHIYYIIPYLTILRQNSKTIDDILDCKEHILNHFTSYSLDEDEADEHIDIDLITERWDSDIVLTSMVQFLNTLFLGKKSSARRMHQLANSIIILDEIQALPLKCFALFNYAMNFLVDSLNCTIIFCTATQPELSNVEYPLRFTKPIDIVADYDLKFLQFQRVCITVEIKDKGFNNIDTSRFIIDHLHNKKNALIIMNTKKVVVEIYKMITAWNEENDLKNQYHIFCLTTNQCLAHRNDILCQIDNLLKNNERVLCISTNLIEAGIDIDFEMVVKDLAGLDSIAQAAGRCNRHGYRHMGDVHIINNNESYLNSLEYIKHGIAITKVVLNENREKDLDLLSPKIMKRYYELFYANMKDNMKYQVKEINNNLLSLLSINDKIHDTYELVLRQAFKTAGSLFRVIDEDTIDVIVPYGKGKGIIEKLNSSNLSYSSLKMLLKESQSFTISLRKDSIKRKSDIGICRIDDSELYILKGGSYDEKIGMQNMSFQSEFV